MPNEAVRKEVQLCYPFSEERLLNQGRLRSIWRFPALYQHKLNGERCRAVVSHGRCLLFSSTEELILTLPHINNQMIQFPDGEYDGELYVHGWTQSEIHSAVSTTVNIHPRAHKVQFHLFDIITEEIQIARSTNLEYLFNERKSYSPCYIPQIELIDTWPVYSLEEIMALYDRSISESYEGFVLKDINSRIIYAALSGFGQYGPYSSRGSYASISEAMSIHTRLNGDGVDIEGPPILIPGAYGDLGPGSLAAMD